MRAYRELVALLRRGRRLSSTAPMLSASCRLWRNCPGAAGRERLRLPGRALEELLEVATRHRGDGHELTPWRSS